MNRIRNITLKIGLVFVSFYVGAILARYLFRLLLQLFGIWYIPIITVLMIGFSYLFRATFHGFNPRHWLFRRFIQFFLFQLIVFFYYVSDFNLWKYMDSLKMTDRELKPRLILDPNLEKYIAFLLVLLSIVAIMVAVTIIFSTLYRARLDFKKSFVILSAITLLILQFFMPLMFVFSGMICTGYCYWDESSVFSPDGTREIRLIIASDSKFQPSYASPNGFFYITRIVYSPVWKTIPDISFWGGSERTETSQKFIWSKDSSKVYLVEPYYAGSIDRKRIDPARIVFGYDFRSDREIDPETACSDYREIPDLILPNETCPQKPEPDNPR